MTHSEWKKFTPLYEQLEQFQEMRLRSAGKLIREDDEFSLCWNNFRASAVEIIIKNAESARDCDDFINWLQLLLKIIKNEDIFWNIIHTEVQPTLKVTVGQSHKITSTFFSPNRVFELGVDPFLNSSLCDFSKTPTEDQLVDLFYVSAGFIRACRLPQDYIITHPHWIEFVQKILGNFISIVNFDPEKFIFVAEAISVHLHLNKDAYATLLQTALQSISTTQSSLTFFDQFRQACILATSPLLQNTLNPFIQLLFKRTMVELRTFLRTYIFGSLVECKWDIQNPVKQRVSDPLRAWELYLKNFKKKIRKFPDLPETVLKDTLLDSVSYFAGYYGEVQPTVAHSKSLRRDIFFIVETFKSFYPGDVCAEGMQSIWFLLYIAAVSGATSDQVSNVKTVNYEAKDPLFLDLEHNETEFAHYSQALSRLSVKFKDEADSFPIMVEFIRLHYND